MADFHQSRFISTLHRLKSDCIDGLEKHLEDLVHFRPVALVLPCLYRDVDKPPMIKIREELKKVRYINEIIITMGDTNKEQFLKAKEFFRDFPLNPKIIWNTGPNMHKLYEILKENNFDVGDDGKGRSMWLAYGYVIANNSSSVIAIHDCDISTYTNELLARLCYPVVNRNLGYEFCKGYYARFTNRLHGRVTRLFITPMLRSLRMLVGDIPYLEYLDSFRYPLAGEFAMHRDLARSLRVLGNWGLEIGILSEMYNNTVPKRICQVDLCEKYDHEHRKIPGLVKMSTDITKAIFRYLTIEGIQITTALFRTLQVNYLRIARDIIERYEHDALINGLKFDRHKESLAVESFVKSIGYAYKDFEKDPLSINLISNWNRINSALPEFFDILLEYVEKDNG